MGENNLLKDSDVRLIFDKGGVLPLDEYNLKTLLGLKYNGFLKEIKKIVRKDINYEDVLEKFLNDSLLPITTYLDENNIDGVIVDKLYDLEDNIHYHIDTMKDYKKIKEEFISSLITLKNLS